MDSVPDVDLEIRRMDRRDLDAVVEIETNSFTTPWSRASFRSLLNRRDTDLGVALVDGRLSGYAVVWYMAEEAELGNLAVAARCRRRGVGGRLLRWALDRARERGARQIHLEVRSSNRAAQALYERHGFVHTGIRRGYYRSPVEDAAIMRHELADRPSESAR